MRAALKRWSLVASTLMLWCLGGCCGDDGDPIDPPPLQADAGPAASARAEDSGDAGVASRVEVEEAVETEPESGDAGSLDGTISITVRDFQVYHPHSTNRSLLDLRDFDRRARVSGGGDFSIGLVLEARNDSPYLLEYPRIVSDVSIVGEHGLAMCKVPRTSGYSRTRNPISVLSPQVSERTPWAEEGRNALEAPWRPQETIRIGATLRCGPIYIHDLAVTGIEGFFNVVARAPFAPHVNPCSRPTEICDDDVVGTSSPIELPARVVSLRQVQISGQPAYVAADLVIRAEDGRVLREVLGEHGRTTLESLGTELPENPASVREISDEWSMTVTSVELRHWTDVSGAPKGSRIVTVAADIRMDVGAIEGRLRTAVDTARQADESARAALLEAQAAAAVEEGDTLRQAEATARSAAAELARAQSAFERSRGSERARLTRLLPCDRVELVTDRRNVRAANAREQGTTCRELTFRNAVRVEWFYVLDRYEIPLGIAYSLGRDPHVAFFAATSLTTFDSR